MENCSSLIEWRTSASSGGRRSLARAIYETYSTMRSGRPTIPDALTRNGVEIKMVKAWWNIGMLAAEAQEVMWLRCMRLAAGGPTASAEAQRMVTEKFAAAASAAAGILMGDLADKVVKHYRRKVRANKRRLSR